MPKQPDPLYGEKDFRATYFNKITGLANQPSTNSIPLTINSSKFSYNKVANKAVTLAIKKTESEQKIARDGDSWVAIVETFKNLSKPMKHHIAEDHNFNLTK